MTKKQIDPSYGYSNLQIPQYNLLYEYKITVEHPTIYNIRHTLNTGKEIYHTPNYEFRLQETDVERNDMNKYENSLENIGYLHSFDEDGDTGELLQDVYKKDFNNLQELIDKATPKKVFICDTDCFCPNCTTSLVDIRKDSYKQFISKYCTYCGQALDWSEEDGK